VVRAVHRTLGLSPSRPVLRQQARLLHFRPPAQLHQLRLCRLPPRLWWRCFLAHTRLTVSSLGACGWMRGKRRSFPRGTRILSRPLMTPLTEASRVHPSLRSTGPLRTTHGAMIARAEKWRKGKRPAPGPDPAGPSQKMQRVEVSAADWYCHECDHLNFAKRNACLVCAAQQRYSAADPRPGDWICGECNNHNFARGGLCRVCSSRPRGKGTKGGPIGKGKGAETFKGKAKVDDKWRGKSKTKGQRPTSVPSLRGEGPFALATAAGPKGGRPDATPMGPSVV
jgi:hypothetical protein